jgi:hypothetical protein
MTYRGPATVAIAPRARVQGEGDFARLTQGSPMTEASPANLELAVALPLGVVANQLMRIETDLRFLNMKALAYANERESGDLAAKIAGGLEKINGALDLIRGLVADIEANIQPLSRPGTSSRNPASRKPFTDRDD